MVEFLGLEGLPKLFRGIGHPDERTADESDPFAPRLFRGVLEPLDFGGRRRLGVGVGSGLATSQDALGEANLVVVREPSGRLESQRTLLFPLKFILFI